MFMFITNPESIQDAYICRKLKAKYIIKHFHIAPFYHGHDKDGSIYYFAIKEKDLRLPWYIKILR